MVERLRPKAKAVRCGHDAWHELLHIMNSRPDVVLPRMDYLDEVLQCHAEYTGETVQAVTKRHLPSLRVPSRKYYAVNRLELFAFVNAHGVQHEH